MTETVNNEITNGKDLVYTESFWSGRRSLSYDGKELKRESNKKFVLETEKGNTEFQVSGNVFKGVNVSSSVFGSPVNVVRKLTPLEYILAILVFIPGVVFGAIGGAVGGVIACVNLYIMPKIETLWLKIVVAVEFCAVAGFAAFWLAYAVGMLFWQ